MITAIVLLGLGGLGAVKAGLTGGDFMFDLEQVQPALAKTAPVLPDPHTPRLARRVFVVIVDGLRLLHYRPRLERLLAQTGMGEPSRG